MIEIIKYPDEKYWSGIVQRPDAGNNSVKELVQTILQDVKTGGDVAVKKYEMKFSRTPASIAQSGREETRSPINKKLKKSILEAKTNIEKFHRSQVQETKRIQIQPGIKCWQKSVAIERVGIYIPGGSAPLFSTVLMLAIPAQIAGCKDIILCTPPVRPQSEKKGIGAEVNPAILFAAELCGIKKIFPVGGAQAVAAMAYGTETISKVDKIFGPGNQYVTMAKQLVQMDGVAIDMPAGPSEVLIIADHSAIPSFVAADLLSQAEHGPDSQVILVTTEETLAAEVAAELTRQIQDLPRKVIAEKCLRNSKMILVKTLAEAIGLSDQYAPEHLILAVEEPGRWAEQITNAGSVFLGNYSPEAIGDYASGTNHVLPTNGFAKSYSGVSVESFMKKITFQQLNKTGLKKISETVMTMAAAEGLEGHKNAVSIRL